MIRRLLDTCSSALAACFPAAMSRRFQDAGKGRVGLGVSRKKPEQGGLLNVDPVRTAMALADSQGFEAAFRHAEATFGPGLRPALDILRANQAIASGDHQRWRRHVNAYLAAVGGSPVALEGSGPVFERLSSDGMHDRVEGPLVSVLMPAWNAEKTIAQSIASVLGQTWSNLELIIVDDCSSDDTWSLLQEFAAADQRIKLLRNKINMGLHVSRNLALTEAVGEWVTGHDADAWAHPKRIQMHMQEILGACPLPRASSASMLCMNADGIFRSVAEGEGLSCDGVARSSSVVTMYHAAFMRDTIGGWDSVRCGADGEMMARVRRVLGGDFQELRQVGAFCRDRRTTAEVSPRFFSRTGAERTQANARSRSRYRAAWMKWHVHHGGSDLRLPLIQQPRAFEAPEEMLVKPDEIQRNLPVRVRALRDHEPVTVICVSKRPACARLLAKNILGQTHPNFDVVFVGHGSDYDVDVVRREFADFPRIRIIRVVDPGTVLADGLNMALDQSACDLVAKFDDDDHYGPDYLINLSQVMELQKSEGVSLVGKHAFFTFVESMNVFGMRFSDSRTNCFVNKVHGGTLLWRRSAVGDLRFERVVQGTDTLFQKAVRARGGKIYSGDPFDFVHVRYADVGQHTWRIDDEEYMRPVRTMSSGLRLDLAYSRPIPRGVPGCRHGENTPPCGPRS